MERGLPRRNPPRQRRQIQKKDLPRLRPKAGSRNSLSTTSTRSIVDLTHDVERIDLLDADPDLDPGRLSPSGRYDNDTHVDDADVEAPPPDDSVSSPGLPPAFLQPNVSPFPDWSLDGRSSWSGSSTLDFPSGSRGTPSNNDPFGSSRETHSEPLERPTLPPLRHLFNPPSSSSASGTVIDPLRLIPAPLAGLGPPPASQLTGTPTTSIPATSHAHHMGAERFSQGNEFNASNGSFGITRGPQNNHADMRSDAQAAKTRLVQYASTSRTLANNLRSARFGESSISKSLSVICANMAYYWDATAATAEFCLSQEQADRFDFATAEDPVNFTTSIRTLLYAAAVSRQLPKALVGVSTLLVSALHHFLMGLDGHSITQDEVYGNLTLERNFKTATFWPDSGRTLDVIWERVHFRCHVDEKGSHWMSEWFQPPFPASSPPQFLFSSSPTPDFSIDGKPRYEQKITYIHRDANSLRSDLPRAMTPRATIPRSHASMENASGSGYETSV